MLLSPARLTGAVTLTGLKELGRFWLFVYQALARSFHWPFPYRKSITQAYLMGVNSVFVILLIGLFTGMALGLQGYYALSKFGSEGFLGGVVALTLIRELGPVLAAIMIVGQAGSAMAAEIADMRNSEQIDALQSMAIDPLRFLVSPRLLAAILAFPLLTVIFDVVGIYGGYLTAVQMLQLDSGTYWASVESSVVASDVISGFTKAIVFSLLTTAICCYQGYYVHTRKDGHGSRGISLATTTAVVYSSVSILGSNYVVTSFFIK